MIGKTKILILLLLSGSVFVNSCHKFPEDKFISLRQPKKRLAGKWSITSYQINGTEHYHDFDSILSPKTLKDIEFEFQVDTKDEPMIYRLNNGSRLLADGSVKFATASTISFYYVNYYSFAEKFWDVPHGSFSADLGIRELYKKDFHLRKGGLDIYFKKK